MDKKEQAIGETTEVADTKTIEEQSDDTQTESDTVVESSDGDSPPNENSGDAQNVPESGETETTPKSEPTAPDSNVLTAVDQHLSTLQDMFEKQIDRNQNQKQMFDTIYNEMKGYRDNVLLEAFHKPVIHNLIQLYDNFMTVESQLKNIIETTKSQTENSKAPIQSFEMWFSSLDDNKRSKFLHKNRKNKELVAILESCPTELPESQSRPQTNTELEKKLKNLEIVRLELEEVLYRMDVSPYEERLKKLDKKLHKTLGTIPIDDPDQNGEVAEVHKVGFYWRGKVFRPEEVTIFRYKPPANEGEETVDEKPTAETKETVG